MIGGSQKKKILMVEDDEYTRPLYKDAFEADEFEVCMMENADDGFLERVAEFEPDVISMDIMIEREGAEGMRDGFDAIEALKGDLRTHEIPVIVLSNFIAEEKVERAASLGVVDYIVASSYTPQEIVKVFARFLEDPAHYHPMHPHFQGKAS